MNIIELYKILWNEIEKWNWDKEIIFEWNIIDPINEIQEIKVILDVNPFYIYDKLLLETWVKYHSDIGNNKLINLLWKKY